jgi:hypothetical protein
VCGLRGTGSERHPLREAQGHADSQVAKAKEKEMSNDAWNAVAAIVLVLAIAGYLGWVRWLQHKELMSGKKPVEDEK